MAGEKAQYTVGSKAKKPVRSRGGPQKGRATTVDNDANQLSFGRLDAVLERGLEKPAKRPGPGRGGVGLESGDV